MSRYARVRNRHCSLHKNKVIVYILDLLRSFVMLLCSPGSDNDPYTGGVAINQNDLVSFWFSTTCWAIMDAHARHVLLFSCGVFFCGGSIPRRGEEALY